MPVGVLHINTELNGRMTYMCLAYHCTYYMYILINGHKITLIRFLTSIKRRICHFTRIHISKNLVYCVKEYFIQCNVYSSLSISAIFTCIVASFQTTVIMCVFIIFSRLPANFATNADRRTFCTLKTRNRDESLCGYHFRSFGHPKSTKRCKFHLAFDVLNHFIQMYLKNFHVFQSRLTGFQFVL